MLAWSECFFHNGRWPRSRWCRLLYDSLNIIKDHETLLKHCETSWNTRHLIRRYRRLMRGHRRSARWHRRSRGVSGDIGDCSIGITLQMCNRVTNHGDMGTFSKPADWRLPVWIFLFMMKHTSLTYLHGKWPISQCAANIWMHPLSHESPRRFKWRQFKLN